MPAKDYTALLQEAEHQYEGWEEMLSSNPLLRKGASLCGEIEQLGGEALIVGGVVRDLILGKPVNDVDIATNVPLEKIEAKFKTVDIGQSKDFGIVSVLYGDEAFEVAHYRSDGDYSDNRRPDDVSLEQSFEADSLRRDFTINAMGINKEGVIIDHHGGVEALKNKVIQAVGDPDQRFKEDALRLLRAIRFAARLGFEIEEDTKRSIMELSQSVQGLSPERVRDELFKAAKNDGNTLASYIEHLDDVGLLEQILPEVKALQGLEHNPEHHPEGDVWEHVLAAVRASGSKDPVKNLAILFHDLGKAVTRGYKDDGSVTYYGHEAAGVPIFVALARRLKFSNAEREAIEHSVEHHMQGHLIDQMTDKKALKLRQSPHWDVFRNVVKADAKSRLHLWDEEAFERDMARLEALHARYGDQEALRQRVKGFIDGRRVVALTGAKGPEIGRILSAVSDWLIDVEFHVSPEEVETKIREVGLTESRLQESPNIWEPDKSWGLSLLNRPGEFEKDKGKRGAVYFKRGFDEGFAYMLGGGQAAKVEGHMPSPASDYWLLTHAVTSPEHRRKGLVSSLVLACLDRWPIILVDSEISAPMLGVLQKLHNENKIVLHLGLEGYDPMVGDNDDCVMISQLGYTSEEVQDTIQFEWDDIDDEDELDESLHITMRISEEVDQILNQQNDLAENFIGDLGRFGKEFYNTYRTNKRDVRLAQEDQIREWSSAKFIKEVTGERDAPAIWLMQRALDRELDAMSNRERRTLTREDVIDILKEANLMYVQPNRANITSGRMSSGPNEYRWHILGKGKIRKENSRSSGQMNRRPL